MNMNFTFPRTKFFELLHILKELKNQYYGSLLVVQYIYKFYNASFLFQLHF